MMSTTIVPTETVSWDPGGMAHALEKAITTHLGLPDHRPAVLVGSRALLVNDPGSDWDVMICRDDIPPSGPHFAVAGKPWCRAATLAVAITREGDFPGYDRTVIICRVMAVSPLEYATVAYRYEEARRRYMPWELQRLRKQLGRLAFYAWIGIPTDHRPWEQPHELKGEKE